MYICIYQRIYQFEMNFNEWFLFVLFFSLGRGRFDVGPSRGPKWDWGSSRGRHGCPGPTNVRPCRGSNPMALSTSTVQSGSESAVSGYSTPGRHSRAGSQSRYTTYPTSSATIILDIFIQIIGTIFDRFIE